MAFHRKHGPTWSVVSVNTTHPCARLRLIMACPTKPSDASFVLLATREQDKPCSFPPVLGDTYVRCDSHAGTLFTTCSYGVCIEPGTFFSHVHTLQACLSRTFPCLLLMHGLSAGYAIDARQPVQKQCSRGGRKEHGSHLDRGREKVANRKAFLLVCVIMRRYGSVASLTSWHYGPPGRPRARLLAAHPGSPSACAPHRPGFQARVRTDAHC